MSKLTDRLRQHLKVTNERGFAQVGGATTFVTYSVHDAHWISRTDRRATVHVLKDGKWYYREFRERAGSTTREDRLASVQAAQDWASARYGVTEWVRGPFRDSWMPRDAYDRAMTALKEAENA